MISTLYDFKDFAKKKQKKKQADKVLRDKAFNIAKDPKYNRYQRRLASIVYTFFDKKTAGSGIKSMPQTEQLAEELHKSIIEKFKKRKVYSAFKGNIWGADLADMQLISKCNKGFRFLLCVIDIFNKYAWVVPLKDKKGVSIVNAFKINLYDSKRKPNKIWLIKEVSVIKTLLRNGYETMILLCIQHIMKENLLLLKNLLEL